MSALSGSTAGKPRSVLVVGNYAPDKQRSMQAFGRTLADNLRRLGVKVAFTAPPVVFGRFAGEDPRLLKLFGYLDKFLIFPAILAVRSRLCDIVHIADHSNALYLDIAGRRRTLVTCHDLFAVRIMLGEVPGQSWGLNGRILQKLIFRGVRRARRLTAVSEATLAELRRLIGPDVPATFIPNALPETFVPVAPEEADRRRAALGLDPAIPYFLHVGGNQFYKNRPGVVRLFGELAKTAPFAKHRLVLAGKPPNQPLLDALAQSPVRDRIDVVVDAADADILALYSRAEALLFISLDEGFGWPVLEAQACGCPVVTSDRDPMRSVAGAAAVLVNPEEPVSAAAIIAEAASGLADMREAGFANARAYAPGEVFPRYLDVYREF
ncbi:glycosyltransferase [Novosphingobium nitrogenifigens]|nr:glycosyltransferase [Novosphingobium nitrogenifigens]